MHGFRLVFMGLVLLGTQALASVSTLTHTYLLSTYENSLLCIDRQTGQETVIPVGNHPHQVVLHGGYAYTVNIKSRDLTVIDLKTNKVRRTIKLKQSSQACPVEMIIHGDKGYVRTIYAGLYRDDKGQYYYPVVQVIDLKTQSLIGPIKFPDDLRGMVKDGDVLYAYTWKNHMYGVDLKTSALIYDYYIPSFVEDIAIFEGKGYLFTDDQIRCIDPKTGNTLSAKACGKCAKLLYLRENLAYIQNFWDHKINIYDLRTMTHLKTIDVNPYLMYVHKTEVSGHLLFLQSFSAVFIFDLQAQTFVEWFVLPHDKLGIDVTDSHLYFGVTKLRPHMLTLFDHPYTGLSPDLCLLDDGENEFIAFENSRKKGDFGSARSHFELALGAGHP